MLSNIDIGKLAEQTRNAGHADAICLLDGCAHRCSQIHVLILENLQNKFEMLDTPMPSVFLMVVHANIYGY